MKQTPVDWLISNKPTICPSMQCAPITFGRLCDIIGVIIRLGLNVSVTGAYSVKGAPKHANPCVPLPFTALDIESAGTDPYEDQIVELGLAEFSLTLTSLRLWLDDLSLACSSQNAAAVPWYH